MVSRPSGKFLPGGPSGRFQPYKPRFTEFYGTNTQQMNRQVIENLNASTAMAADSMFGQVISAGEQKAMLFVQMAASREIAAAQARIDGAASTAEGSLAEARGGVDITA